MKANSIFAAGVLALAISISAVAGTVQLNVPFDVTNNYVFPLAGGGGGAMATLNGVSVEIFCDDFDYGISLNSNDTADVTTLGTSTNLDDTRFGGVASNGWTAITLNDGNPSLDSTDDAFFNTGNGTSALARYEMVAYLVSLYNQGQGSSTSNNQIQEAIWTIMDPNAEGPVPDPSGVNPDNYLEQAVAWYDTMNTSANLGALNTFLSGFEVVDSTDMSFSNGLGKGGFQEQIVMNPVATPEPKGGVWIAVALLLGVSLVLRRQKLTGRACFETPACDR